MEGTVIVFPIQHFTEIVSPDLPSVKISVFDGALPS